MTTATTGTSEAEHEPTSRVAVAIGTTVGLACIAVGVWFAFDQRSDTHPFELARWAVAADLVHDLWWAPLAIAGGWIVGRVVPPVARGAVRWALATTAVLTLYAWPFLRGYGRTASVPSLLPRNYALGLLAYVAAVWVVAAAWIVVRIVRSRLAQSGSISHR